MESSIAGLEGGMLVGAYLYDRVRRDSTLQQHHNVGAYLYDRVLIEK